MRISKEEILHVADLARLDIDEVSIDTFANQMGKILEYIDALNRIDTTDVEPTSHAISLSNAFREDEIDPSFDRDAALSNAPETEDGYFIVAKVVG